MKYRPVPVILLLVLQASLVSAQVRVVERADGSKYMYNTASKPGISRGVAMSTAPSSDLESAIRRNAQRERLDPKLVRAVIAAESGFDPRAVSHKGAIGLMQLMPATAAALGVDPLDPEQNLRGGTSYLRQMLDAFDGQMELALAAYNAGPDAVRRYSGIPPYAETVRYVEKVMRAYRGDSTYVAPRVSIARRGRRPVLVRQADGSWLMTTSR